MNLYSKASKWDDVKEDVEAIKFHALQYLTGHRDALAKTAFQHVKHVEHTKGIVVNLWNNNADDLKS